MYVILLQFWPHRPERTTVAFWFYNPFQPQLVQRSVLDPVLQRVAEEEAKKPEKRTWLLEMHDENLNRPTTIFFYEEQSASWKFIEGYEAYCPSHQCTVETLGEAPPFLMPCVECETALDCISRVFVTSLLLKSGIFRQSRSFEVVREQSEFVHHAVTQPRGPQEYTIVEFEASLHPRSRPPSRTTRAPWTQDREVIELNGLTKELADDAVVSVDLSYSGIKRELRSNYFTHKQGAVIQVKDYTVQQVKMTYATYKRWLQKKRITKVVAARFAGLVIEDSSPL